MIESEKERIERVMEMEGMNSAIFASAIGIQGSTLSHILNGRNKPSLAVLQSILKRFPNINPDWLILGQGSVDRAVKQSQAPTLFDSLDETPLKSAISEPVVAEKTGLQNQSIQKNNDQQANQAVQNTALTQVVQQLQPVQPEISSKSVNKIIVYYSDNTFQEFHSV